MFRPSSTSFGMGFQSSFMSGTAPSRLSVSSPFMPKAINMWRLVTGGSGSLVGFEGMSLSPVEVVSGISSGARTVSDVLSNKLTQSMSFRRSFCATILFKNCKLVMRSFL